MIRILRNALSGLLRLGAHEVVFDRTTGALHYRNAAGVATTTGVGVPEMLLRVTTTGSTEPPLVEVLHTSVGVTVGAVVRTATGTYTLPLSRPLPLGTTLADWPRRAEMRPVLDTGLFAGDGEAYTAELSLGAASGAGHASLVLTTASARAPTDLPHSRTALLRVPIPVIL